MKCPVDNIDLVMSDRQGIEIDYCPQCRGVWLDRGEIDKIVERSLTMGGPAPQVQQTPQQQPYPQQQQQMQHQPYQQHRDYDDDDDHYRHQNGNNQHHKRKESWFGELFD